LLAFFAFSPFLNFKKGVFMNKGSLCHACGAVCLAAVLFFQGTSMANWEITISGVSKVAVADSFVFASTTSGVRKSKNGGAPWLYAIGIKTFHALEGNATKIYATGDSGLVASADHGSHWNIVSTPNREYYSVYSGYFALSVQDSRILLAGRRYFLSEDNGQTWKILNTNYNSFQGLAITSYTWSSCIVGNILLLGSSAGISRSVNHGLSWQEANYGLDNVLSYEDNTRILTDQRTVWVNNISPSGGGYGYSGLSCSKDSGSTWNSFRINRWVQDMCLSKTTLFAATDSGVYASPKDSALWTDISMSPETSMVSISVDTAYLYAASASGTLYRRPLAEVNAAVHKQRAQSQFPVAEKLVLEKNDPNRIVTILFNAGISQKASVKVFGADGRNVVTLFEGSTGTGVRKCIWNHETAPSGLYLVRLRSEMANEVKRVNIIK
jgi:hypothetical protein